MQAQYNQCIEQNIPVVLPQWLDDCFRLKKRLDTKLYQYPDPIVFYETNPTPAKLYPYHDLAMISSGGDHNRVFEDEVLYFGHDLNIKEDFKVALTEAIARAGGTVVDQYNYQKVTIVILKDRGTQEFRMVSKDAKLVASLWWLTNTLLRGYCNSPLCTLLDYPTPPGGMPEMNDCVITIAGYGNVTRFYLRRLVTALGAKYDPALNSETTHLICGRMISDKYSKAVSLPNVTIVNHLWLEECYQQWKIMDPNADRRYRFIPNQKPILDATAARTHLLIIELERWIDPRTMPEHTVSRARQVISKNDIQGSVHVRKRREAAIQATRLLNDIVIPDANAYEKEAKRKRSH
ncbi:BRCT domain-containing protein [Mucor mucedo]|uniref:BRCT domain-containing protein n=1 Tax=Mucor mucedo TaxID=29922 RepID=UPI002220695A|nr:BRCT domain-containing protein [Mucor mucedo]KAI7866570.1 BRCT domain-containing protein [Mucor mucedo]